MAVTTSTISDVSQGLASALAAVEDLRVYWYVADSARVPLVVVSLPDIDYTDSGAGFCQARWDYTLTIVVSRNADRTAQEALSRMVQEVATALNDAEPEGVFSIEPIGANPVTATIAGSELPGYQMRVQVRA